MGAKGVSTTADYLPFPEYLRLLQRLHADGFYQWEAYAKISFFTALRVTDVRSTCWKDILGKSELVKVEKKTGKTRHITINKEMQEEIQTLYHLLGQPNPNQSIICNPCTGKAYSREQINHVLKVFRYKYKLKIRAFSTHSFRKTFGRYVYESMGRTGEALIILNQIFQHKDMDTTRRYIGLLQEDVANVYASLSFAKSA